MIITPKCTSLLSPYSSQLPPIRGLLGTYGTVEDYEVAQYANKVHNTSAANDKLIALAKRLSTNVTLRDDKHLRQIQDSLLEGPLSEPWLTTEFRIASGGSTTFKVHYRNVLSVIKFLLSYRPFKDNLHYAPVKDETVDKSRVYTEMHNCDWWWKKQIELQRDDATIVPIIINTDKTALTRHAGDKSAWPVYLTIGNLDGETRRSHTRPGYIFIGLLPISASIDKQDNLVAELYHKSMGIIFECQFTANDLTYNLLICLSSYTIVAGRCFYSLRGRWCTPVFPYLCGNTSGLSGAMSHYWCKAKPALPALYRAT